jgi:nucleoside-diphosphate-sugar epimerase
VPACVGPYAATDTISQIHALDSLDNLNTSNQRILAAAQGKWKDEIAATGVHLWVDVRDVAEAHVAAAEKEEAANKRFFTLAGHFSNKQIGQIIKKHFPQFKDLPVDSTPGGDYPEGGIKNYFSFNNERSVEVLGLRYRTFEESIVDTVKSFQAKGL